MRKSLFNKDIKPEILSRISKAKNQINLAIAWITDIDILDTLTLQAIKGIDINIILSAVSDRDILENLEKNGKGKIKLYVLGKEHNNLMHHKFCVIDDSTTITGSYNYTYNAINNDENILVIDGDSELAKTYLNEFDRMLEQFKETRRELFQKQEVVFTEEEQYFRDSFVKLPPKWKECIAKSILYSKKRLYNYYLLPPDWRSIYFDYGRIEEHLIQRTIKEWSNTKFGCEMSEDARYLDVMSTSEFYIVDTKIKDLTPLNLFPRIKLLCVENSEIDDFSFLKTMEYLEILKISNCSVMKLDFIPWEYKYKLKGLDLSNTFIEDFSEIKHLHNLEWLNLNDTYLKSLDFLKGISLTKLKALYVLNTVVKDITPIDILNQKEIEYVHSNLTWPDIKNQLVRRDLFMDEFYEHIFYTPEGSKTSGIYARRERNIPTEIEPPSDPKFLPF